MTAVNAVPEVHLMKILAGSRLTVVISLDAWTPPPDFVRIRWDHETFFGDVMVYGQTPAAECWTFLPAGCRGSREGR
jgi:hypothetical protein